MQVIKQMAKNEREIKMKRISTIALILFQLMGCAKQPVIVNEQTKTPEPTQPTISETLTGYWNSIKGYWNSHPTFKAIAKDTAIVLGIVSGAVILRYCCCKEKKATPTPTIDTAIQVIKERLEPDKEKINIINRAIDENPIKEEPRRLEEHLDEANMKRILEENYDNIVVEANKFSNEEISDSINSCEKKILESIEVIKETDEKILSYSASKENHEAFHYGRHDASVAFFNLTIFTYTKMLLEHRLKTEQK